MKEKVIDLSTGESLDRDLTSEEINEREIDELKNLKESKLEEIYEKCDESIGSFFTSVITNSNGVPYEIFYDSIAQEKLNGQMNLVNKWLNELSLGIITKEQFDAKFPIDWRTKNHGWVKLTYDEYSTIIEEASQHERINYKKRGQLEYQIELATTIEEVQVISWNDEVL